MKKLFTLVALLALFLGAKAETVVDFERDYSTQTWEPGWTNETDHIKYEDGCIHFHSDEAKPNFYDYQYQLHQGIQNVDNDALYTITLRIKGSVAQSIHASFSGSNTPGMIPVTTDWVDVVLENCVNDPNAQYFANSGSLLIQPGDYVGDIWISYIKITHEEKGSSRPVEWISVLTNGDAETAWPSWSLETTNDINANWRGDRTGEICAWALTMGRNFDDQNTVIKEDSPRARPFPADIEEEKGNTSNHVFAVHVTQIAAIDDNNPETDDAASIAWSNQFWIQSSRAIKAGTKVHLKFRYKAQNPCTVATQIHKKNPSDYLHYVAIGDVNFTTEWKEYDETFTFSDAQNNGWSVAFNLCSDADNGRTENVFYFDDLSWEIVKLDEGWFVASSNTATGLEYDYDNATEFVYDEGEDAFVATVGTVGDKSTWVNEVMISTVRGQTAAFKGATIKPSKVTKGDDPDNWLDYAAGSQYKVALPAAGVWQISVAPATDEEIADDPEKAGTGQILFMMLEGDAVPDPIDVVTNNTTIVVNAKEREDLKDSKNNEGVITVNEEADDPEGVNVGGEGHNGQTYDNQFFIKANRALKAGEETVIEFTYSATKAARSTTQCHGENPGAYMHWNCIPAVEFTTEEQTYKQEFTVPAEADGMWCIAFDLAVIKEANDYTFKDFKWYLKYDEEDKTIENLINETGDSNFYKKEGAGTSPYIPSGIFDVINDATTRTDVIYNLSGQRVSKDYKGIVIMNGRKVVNK